MENRHKVFSRNESTFQEENRGRLTTQMPKTDDRTPALKKLRDAFFQHHDAIFDACFFRFFFKKLQRFIDRLM